MLTAIGAEKRTRTWGFVWNGRGSAFVASASRPAIRKISSLACLIAKRRHGLARHPRPSMWA
jgi:hypothetical protein